MKITPEITKLVESLPDEDIRQDIYVKILEWDRPYPDDWERLIHTIYGRLLTNRATQSRRRKELLYENREQVLELTGDDDTQDPMELLQAEALGEKIDQLSAVLKETASLYYMSGLSAEEIARMHGITKDVVYKRVQRVREALGA